MDILSAVLKIIAIWTAIALLLAPLVGLFLENGSNKATAVRKQSSLDNFNSATWLRRVYRLCASGLVELAHQRERLKVTSGSRDPSHSAVGEAFIDPRAAEQTQRVSP